MSKAWMAAGTSTLLRFAMKKASRWPAVRGLLLLSIRSECLPSICGRLALVNHPLDKRRDSLRQKSLQASKIESSPSQSFAAMRDKSGAGVCNGKITRKKSCFQWTEWKICLQWPRHRAWQRIDEWQHWFAPEDRPGRDAQ